MNSTVWGMVRKEFIQALRDRRMRMVIFVIPVVQMVVFGLALSHEVKNIRLSVSAAPNDRWMGEVERRALGSGWFQPGPGEGDPVELLQSGKAHAVLVAPPGGATRALARGEGQVQLLVDATNALRARAVETYLTSIARQLVREEGIDGGGSVVLWKVRTLFNPTLTSAVYLVPGVMGMILGLVTILLTSLSLAREREMGTLDTLLAAPVQRWEIMLGKTLPFFLLGLADVPILVGFARIFFGVPLRGPVWALGLSAAAFVGAMVAAGTLISTFARSQQQAMMGAFLFLFPAVQLSGVMAPLDNLPGWAWPLAYVNPIQYFVSLNRQVMLRGALGTGFWWRWGALCALAGGMVVWASLRLTDRKIPRTKKRFW